MHKDRHGSKINFNFILDECKKRYAPFDKRIERRRRPKDIISAIQKAKEDGKNPVIGEVKPRSPTSDTIKKIDPQEAAVEMIKGGACALSVLTEPEFFGGSLENLRRIQEISPIALLRKDFIFHPAQIPESYYYGADSLLLISSFFTTETLKDMIEMSRALGMEPLVEVHNREDIDRAADAGAKLYAVNNRDKDTLEIDLHRTAELSPYIRGVKVSASGIENRGQLKEVLKYADAALIGTSIMRAADIRSKVSGFVKG